MNKQEKRQIILTAAIQLMSEKGYETVTMRMIAQRAKCQTSTIYHYFDSKEEILEGIQEYFTQSFEVYRFTDSELLGLLQSQSAADILHRYVTTFDKVPQALRLQLFRLLFIETYQNKKIRRIAYSYFIAESEKNQRYILDILSECDAIPPGDNGAVTLVWIRCSLIYGYLGTLFQMDQMMERFHEMVAFFIESITRGVTPVNELRSSVTAELRPPLPVQAVSPENTKDKLVAATLRLVNQYGGNNVSIRMISDEVGIQPGSAYNHFASKDELLQVAMEDLFRMRRYYLFDKEAVLEAFRTRDPEIIMPVLSRCNPQLYNEPEMMSYRIIFREQFYTPYIREAFWKEMQDDIHLLAEAFEQLSGEGVIPACNGKQLASLYIYAMTGINAGCAMYPQELERMEESRRLACRWILGLILNGWQS